MFLKTIRLISLLILFISFNLKASAITAEDYCKVHDDSGVPGTCTVCVAERWVIIKDNLGNDTCKKCGDDGCIKTECSECKEYPACME